MARLAGRLTDWNDAKGFGFVAPNGGGERCFVHVHDFPRGTRRPIAGDLISYLPALDARGRPRAQDARLAGETARSPSRAVRGPSPGASRPTSPAPRRLPRIALGIIVLLLVGIAVAGSWLPIELAAACGFSSVISLLAYLVDKAAARRGEQRVPEMGLHLVDLLGGWPGALIAQGLFRHKTVKRSFQAAFWVTVGLNLAAVAWLLYR